ncbi:MAG: nicotinate (nicotinamide) nucleotide adenylyltransferase [Gemmatimonadetes bacterium]|nr:nicotinate-nucleotide adenylyltransferase [Gemmatimonadota bacterium]NNL30489.1 nicotinate (nicotinamide) nucleotide adenylyltransferase [Gemmatimonadota bacterium]
MFGGTFDPPHLGHRSVALDVADVLDLDEVVWIPAGDPPHKRLEQLTPAHLRLRMVRAATMGEPRFSVSEIEVNREGPSYTVDTLRALRSKEPKADLYLIVGIDQYRTFDTWRAPEEILTLASLAVMDRGGESLRRDIDAEDTARRPNSLHLPPGTVISVPVKRIDVSSTRVRAAVDRGESIVALVPRAVARIIEAEGLYRRVDR